MLPRSWLCAVFIVVAGCGDNSPRYLLDMPEPAETVSVRVSSIEVRDVTLPAYAAASEIVLLQDDGAVRPVSNAVWADDPLRSVTQSLARNLDAATTATAAAEPWPLDTPAQVRIDVRIDRMVARPDGKFQMAGQYSIAAPYGAVRETINRFDILQPMADQSPGAIAQANSDALVSLSAEIAQALSR